jgi:RimJ/RimL family protein N-acetyltransferase
MDWEKKEAEYGIFIGEGRALHHGFGSLAADWAAKYAKEEMHLEHLVVRIYADNPASLAACEHAGYKITERVDRYVCIDGVWRDIYFLKNDI